MKALLRLLLPQWSRVALAVLLGALVVLSNMGLLAAAAYLIAAASVTHLMALLLVPMFAVRILSVTRGSARYVERLTSHRATFDVLARLRVRLFDRLRQLGPAGMQGTHSGDALDRIMGDVEDLQNAYLLFLSPVAVALIVSALSFAVVLVFSRELAWTTLGYLMACGLALPIAIGKLTRKAGRALVYTRGELNAHLVDSIQGSHDILTNVAGPRFLETIGSHGRRMADAESRLATARGVREGVADLLTNLAMLTALALAVPLVTRHAIPGLYVAVPALLALASFEAVRPLGQAAETAGRVQAAAGRVLSIGDGRTGGALLVREPEDPALLLPPYSVAFEDVTFAYRGSDLPALRGVSFHVPQGQRFAVVGASGAGKTTLGRVLTRSWDPTAGAVYVAGRDLREYSLHDLRRALGVVAQDTYIFDDSVRSNLLLARPDASTDDLEDALNAVGMFDLVRDLPRGLDTWVGEHGCLLSGGERQRLAAARVLLQDAPIVVLDEVTANLDPRTESELLETLHTATAGRTVLSITHRLVEMDRVDEIVVLDHGQVVERGTHHELSAASGLYRRMLDVQENMLAL